MIEICCKDCLEGIRNWEGETVDVIVTSPPYNLGINYNTYNDKMPRETYLKWINEVFVACKDVLSENGSLFVNLGGKPTDPYLPFQVCDVLKQHFILQNTIHWIKSITIPTDETEKTIGHFKPINSDRFVNDCHEYIFHFTKTGNVKLDRKAIGVPYEDKSNIGRWESTDGSDLRCRGNVWFIPYKTIQSRDKERPHPASFPVELPKRCYQLHGIEKIQMALDPFVGIGSSAVAAKQLGLNFVGYDIDPEYCAETMRNIRKID